MFKKILEDYMSGMGQYKLLGFVVAPLCFFAVGIAHFSKTFDLGWETLILSFFATILAYAMASSVIFGYSAFLTLSQMAMPAMIQLSYKNMKDWVNYLQKLCYLSAQTVYFLLMSVVLFVGMPFVPERVAYKFRFKKHKIPYLLFPVSCILLE